MMATVMVMIGTLLLKEMTTMTKKEIMMVMMMMVTMFLTIDFFIKKEAKQQICACFTIFNDLHDYLIFSFSKEKYLWS